MILEVLICTYNNGIEKIPDILLPPTEQIRWLISFQYSDESHLQSIPKELCKRSDVSVYPHQGTGLSNNRNYAFSKATGDVLLIADDDVRYKEEYFVRILSTFSQYSDLDIGCFQAETYEGMPLHPYPSESFSYADTPKGYWYNSQEIAVRRDSPFPLFDPRFGINSSQYGCGEEEVFLWQAYKKGLKICYFPQVIVRTDGKTTRLGFYTDKRLQRAKGAVLCLMHGKLGASARCLKYALCHTPPRQFLYILYQMLYGVFTVNG